VSESSRQRLEHLFDEATELPPERRSAFLDEACGDDRRLRDELESMLEAHDEAEGFLEDAVGTAARSLLEQEQAGAAIGRKLGAYRLERELGHGGMGKVYLASRADAEYDKRVAIKLIRWGMDDPELRRRFLGERQILARLEHPYIARLLDGGTTDDGVPYVVLDYVEGEPIDRYCERRRLTVEERLRLFRKVCEAVQYAHASLVVHRDIKPGNILVAEDGSPRLLDFGIAKMLEPEPGASTTRTGARVMTPEYASPEQVRGGTITTASDVYSLGVLLYELLCGQKPQPVPADTPPAEVERRICEEEPRPPSVVAPEKLRRRLSGDLDNIVLMALRKEPERRYASVQQLSEDVRRHLEGLPVVARPATLAYRAGKFVQRHRVGLTATAVAAAVIVGLSAFYLVRLGRLNERLAAERDNARLEAAKAGEVAGFLSGLFEVSEPGESRGREVSARELLERGAERIDVELAGQPEVQATMMGVIGGVYQKLGHYDEALPHLERSLEIRRREHGAASPEVAEAMSALGSLVQKRGDHERADSLLTAALELRRALLPEKHPDRVKSLNALAILRKDQGDFEAAEALWRQALDEGDELTAEDREISAAVLSNLGLHLKDLDRQEEAEGLLRDALALRRELFGEEHPEVGTTLNNLGLVLRFQGKYDEAESIYRDLVSWGDRVLGPEHPEYATWLNNLAVLLKDRGAYADAEVIQRQVLAIYRKRYGESHGQVALALNNLANLRHDQGDYEEAERIHLEALQMNRELFGDEHPSVATSLYNLASLLADKGEYARAAEYHRQVLALDRKTLGPEHEYVIGDLVSLGSVLMDADRLENAEAPLREAYDLALKTEGEDHPVTANAAYGLGRLLAVTGRASEAEPLARQALRIREATLPPDHWNTAMARTLLGEALAGLGRFEEAERELLAGYELLREKRAAGDRQRAEARRRLVDLYTSWGKPDRAANVPP